jgi:hypothetical protein
LNAPGLPGQACVWLHALYTKPKTVTCLAPPGCQATADAWDTHNRSELIQQEIDIFDGHNLTEMPLLLAGRSDSTDDPWNKGQSLNFVKG